MFGLVWGFPWACETQTLTTPWSGRPLCRTQRQLSGTQSTVAGIQLQLFALIALVAWKRCFDSALRKFSLHPKYGWNGTVSRVFPIPGPFSIVLRGQLNSETTIKMQFAFWIGDWGKIVPKHFFSVIINFGKFAHCTVSSFVVMSLAPNDCRERETHININNFVQRLPGWGGFSWPDGQGSNVYVGVTEELSMCQMCMRLLWPLDWALNRRRPLILHQGKTRLTQRTLPY